MTQQAYTKNTPMLQAVVFDFDGTLAQLTINFSVMRQAAAKRAALFGVSDQGLDSLPVLEWLGERVAELAGSDADRAQALSESVMEAVVEVELEAAGRARLYDYTRDVLRELREKGLGLGIITRNLAAAVERVFPDWGDYCGVLLARDHVRQVKPHPAHLLEALDMLDARPGQSLMVGDHPMDLETARRAGTLAGAVASGHTDLETLLTHAPDLAAPDCRELLAALKARGLLPV